MVVSCTYWARACENSRKYVALRRRGDGGGGGGVWHVIQSVNRKQRLDIGEYRLTESSSSSSSKLVGAILSTADCRLLNVEHEGMSFN